MLKYCKTVVCRYLRHCWVAMWIVFFVIFWFVLPIVIQASETHIYTNMYKDYYVVCRQVNI